MLVIALGMLVDNAVVISEGVQWNLDHGLPPGRAVGGAVRELALPLAAATATTLAAFVPMLMAEGVTGEFTRAIPVVIMITLTMSYLFAVLVTPALARLTLRPRRVEGRRAQSQQRLDRLAEGAGRLATGRPWGVIAAALVAVLVSLAMIGFVRRDFFPLSDRNQLVVDLKLPEGSHLDATDAAARVLERRLLADGDDVVHVSSFVGRSAPHFYYNLGVVPWSPNFAQIVIETGSTATVDALSAWTRREAQELIPEAEVVVRKLEQGPPVDAPIELRLFGDRLDRLAEAADRVVRVVRSVPGTVDVRHTLSTGSPVLRVEIDDAAAGRRGIDRSDVSTALFGQTRGLPVGQFRADDDPIPIVLRSAAGETSSVSDLPGLDVPTPHGDPVAMGQVARLGLEWRPALIEHLDRRRMTAVLSQLEPGRTYSDVTRELMPRLAELELPEGVELEIGGAAESSGEANSALLGSVPIGVMLLLGILLGEFRSFRRVGIVLATVPLAATGVVPGLLFTGQPFGFMSMLGVVALVGVVVNNAIVLLEVIEARREDGAEVPEAVAQAIARRARPILLATATTVAGLLPLALSETTLWPPLAWAMISGLLASTLLTLLVVPALYVVLFRTRAQGVRRRLATASVLLLATLAVVTSVNAPAEAAEASRLSLEQTMQAARESAALRAVEQRALAAHDSATAARNAGFLPALRVSAGLRERDSDQALLTPIGRFDFGASRSESAEVTLVQPLIDFERQSYRRSAASALRDAADFDLQRQRDLTIEAAVDAFFRVVAIDLAAVSTDAFIDSLENQLEETEARIAAGRTLEVEGLKIQLALDAARQDRLELSEARRAATLEFGRAVGRAEPIEPSWSEPTGSGGNTEPTSSPALPTDLDAAVEGAFAVRADLRALERSVAAAELERKALGATALPRVDASATWVYDSGSPFADDSWIEGGVRLSWAPFQSGTRRPLQRAAAHEADALRLELEEARRAVRSQITAAAAALVSARGRLAVGVTGVEQARETVRVETERYQAGRVTTNELLEAEAALRSQTTTRDIARLEVTRAEIGLRIALGTLTPAGEQARAGRD